MTNNPSLWSEGELPEQVARAQGKKSKGPQYPLWTQNKALLIQIYLRYFTYVTKHGIYIDGFAAPQNSSHLNAWSARLVLENEPKWLKEFWLCDICDKGLKLLDELRDLHTQPHIKPKRRVTVLHGDFNERVSQILTSGRITEKKATFALLDQRVFECEWRTVKALSRHKAGNKIELFYFFATGWIDRSIAAVKLPKTQQKVERWWGRPDWPLLQGMNSFERARLMARRFEDELGYAKAEVFPIHSEARGGRVMYHMIHASDHPEALVLMRRAYRKVSGRPDLPCAEEQLDLLDALRNIHEEASDQ